MADMKPQSAHSEAIAFLLSLRPNGPWTVAAIDPEKPGPPKSLTSHDIAEVHNWVEHYRDGWNLYFQDNPAKTLSKADRYKKLGKEDLSYAEFAKADIDRDEHGVRLIAVEGGKEAMVARLKAGEIEPGVPTYIVDSGNGLQALWRYADPINLQDGDPERIARNLREAEGISRTISASLGADSCWSANHLFRLPGTTNYPDARKRSEGLVAVPTKLLVATGKAYATMDCPLDKALAASIPVGSYEIAPPVFTDIDTLVHQYQLPQSLVQRILTPETDNPLGRSANDWNVCLALLEQGVTPEEVHGVLLNPEFGISSRTLDDSKNGGDAEAFSRRTVVRAVLKDRARRLSEFTSWEEGAAVFEGEGAILGKAFKKWHRFTPAELMAFPDPKWLVDGVLIEKGMSVFFGGPKIGKTYAILHLCLCVATGRPYFGIPVQKGRVLYVISEGNAGEFRDRIRAWCVLNDVDPDSLTGSFEVVRDPVMLDNKDSVDGFLKVDPGPYDLIAMDTFARSMEGDENKTMDMNKAVQGADAVRLRTKAHVLAVHHTQKQGDMERGSSALRGAVDAMFVVRRDEGQVKGEITVATYVNRSAKDIRPIHARLIEVALDNAAEGMALVQIEAPKVVQAEPKTPGNQKRKDGKFTSSVTPNALLMEIVTDGICDYHSLVNEDDKKAGRSLRTIQRHIKELVERGLLIRPKGIRSGDIELTEKGEMVGNEMLFVDGGEMPTEKDD